MRLARYKTPSCRAYPMDHASVVRRYASIPMLALQIDAMTLRALETMPDVVAAVKLDRSLKPQ